MFKLLTLGGLGMWWFIDNMLMMIDAFLYCFGKEKGIVKDVHGNELKYGLSMYVRRNGKWVKDWFQ